MRPRCSHKYEPERIKRTKNKDFGVSEIWQCFECRGRMNIDSVNWKSRMKIKEEYERRQKRKGEPVRRL